MSFKKGVTIVLTTLMLVFLVSSLSMARYWPQRNHWEPTLNKLLRPGDGRMNAHPWEGMLRPGDGRMNAHPWEDPNLLRPGDDDDGSDTEHPWQR